MTTQSPSPVDPSAPVPAPEELKASDFFPPGSGWNQAEGKPEEAPEEPGSSIDDEPGNRH